MNTQPQLERHDPPPNKLVATMAPKQPEYQPAPQQKKKSWLLFVLCIAAITATVLYIAWT